MGVNYAGFGMANGLEHGALLDAEPLQFRLDLAGKYVRRHPVLGPCAWRRYLDLRVGVVDFCKEYPGWSIVEA